MDNSSAVTPFNPFEHPEFGTVRGLMIEGEPWFVASDVARAVGYKKPANAIAQHCKNPKSLESFGALIRGGGVPETGTQPNVISRADVFRFLARSHKPLAERFSDWLFEEVLPILFETGKYEIGESTALAPINVVVEGYQPEPDPDPADNFFAELLPQLEAAVNMCEVVRVPEEEVGHRAMKLLKERYGFDLAASLGSDLQLLGPYDKPANYVDTKAAASMFNATQLGILAQEGKITEITARPEEVNNALYKAELMAKKDYINSKGEKAWRWRLHGEGHSFGKELQLDRCHGDGARMISIKWQADVLDRIKKYL